MVVAAVDTESKTEDNRLVAIKKIDKAFEHRIFAKNTLKTLIMLRELKHENILGI